MCSKPDRTIDLWSPEAIKAAGITIGCKRILEFMNDSAFVNDSLSLKTPAMPESGSPAAAGSSAASGV